jgi:hypothetical protein
MPIPEEDLVNGLGLILLAGEKHVHELIEWNFLTKN